MRPPVTWLITDTHFNHDRMVGFGRPPDYESRLVANLRNVVSEQDVLIHLGDVILYNPNQIGLFLGRVPGRKILVRGNHDKKSNSWFMRNGFDFVADMIVLGEVIYSHSPVQHFPDGVRWNVHGHFHDNDHRHEESAGWYDPVRHLKLAVEDTDYKPVNAQEWIAAKTQKEPTP